jgi:hypothetical protein
VVHALDVGIDLGRTRDDGVNVPPDDGSDVVHREHVVRSRHGDDRRAVLPADGEGVVPTSELLRQERRGCGVEREAIEVDVFEADLAGERTRFVDLRLRRGDATASSLLGSAHGVWSSPRCLAPNRPHPS